MRRRTILQGLSVGVGGLLLGKYAAASLESAVDVDISNIYALPDPAVLRFQWGKDYVWVIRRSAKGLSTLETSISNLKDPLSKSSEQPSSCKNTYRSIHPRILVVVGKCTNDQCIPAYWWPEYSKVEFGENWNGGFHCECCGSLYDLSGRAFVESKATLNMVIPPHHFVNKNRLVIGAEAPNQSLKSGTPQSGAP